MSNALASRRAQRRCATCCSPGSALDSSLSDLQVTTQPPDLARRNVTTSQLNVFLYQTVVNAVAQPGHAASVRPGETGIPAQQSALPLHRMGRESDNDAISHRVLGSAMSVMHDHPLLTAASWAPRCPATISGSNSSGSRSPRCPCRSANLELWMIFQTQCISSCELTVVLIGSHAGEAPLPVPTW
jgi:hypothetical protein